MLGIECEQELRRSGMTQYVEGRLVGMAFSISLSLNLYVKVDGTRD